MTRLLKGAKLVQIKITMTNYIVKVQLNSGSAIDYEFLHSFMKGVGFKKTITSANDLTYQLAPNEYYISSNFDSAQIFEMASTAANRTAKKFEVLVIKTEEVMWSELFELVF